MLGPNITGQITPIIAGNAPQDSGAIVHSVNSTTATGTSSTAWRAILLGLDASRSNSAYTDSGKVYPLSLALNFIIKT
jgi:hypothetical protein